MNTRTIIKEVLSYAKVVVVTWLTVLLMVNFVLKPVVVEGKSMYPTLHDKDIGVSNILSYKISGLDRFDIVIIKPLSGGDLIVKRLIGLPNETVEYVNDKLYIDGVYYEEPYLATDYYTEYIVNSRVFTEDFKVVLSDGEYYCLGDNRPRSSDSRVFGPVSLEQIVSKSVYVLYPFSNFLKGK